nr:hypothetical protein BaRGS_011794 [Batillaria attramentaria]
MGEEQQRNRWVEHFEELLNRQAPQNPPDIEPSKKPSIVWIANPSGNFSDTTGDRLDHDDLNSPEKKRDTMDALETTG